MSVSNVSLNQVAATAQTKVSGKKVISKKAKAAVIGGTVLVGAAACAGIAYAVLKKPAKVTELLDQVKNFGRKSVDEIKNAGKKISVEAQNTPKDVQKVKNEIVEAVQDTVDDVAISASKYKQENLETLDKLGIKFNKGVAEVYGGKFSGDVCLKDKKGQDIFLEFKDGKMIKKATIDKRVQKRGPFMFVEDKKSGNRTRYHIRKNPARVVKEEFIVKKQGTAIEGISSEKVSYFEKDGKISLEALGVIEPESSALFRYLDLGHEFLR